MQKTGKVSVVVPVYNGAETIERTVAILLNSTYSNLEILLVDDGSKDKSLEVCKKLQETDKRILVLEKENGGVASARNFGVASATGEYLCFCDQDDFVEPEMYARMAARMEKEASDICVCGTGRSVDGRKSPFELSEDAFYEGEAIAENLIYPIVFKGFHVPVKMGAISRYPTIWNCMFRRIFWDKYALQFRSYVNFEDDLLLKIDALSRAGKVSSIAYTGYYWNVNLKSETYAHKFVEHLAEKQQLYYEDMVCSVKRCTTEKEILLYFKQVMRCKLYLDAIHILTSPQKKKDMAYIRAFCKETIFEKDFSVSISARKYVAKGQVRAKVLLPLLSKKLSLTSYMAEKVLDYVLWISLHSQTLTKLERKLKGK